MTGRRAGTTPLTSSTIVNEGLHEDVACTRKGKIRKLTGVIGEFLPEGSGEALGTRQTGKSGEQTAQFGGDVRSDLGPRAVHRLLSFLRPRALHLFSRISNRAWNQISISSITSRRGFSISWLSKIIFPFILEEWCLKRIDDDDTGKEKGEREREKGRDE